MRNLLDRFLARRGYVKASTITAISVEQQSQLTAAYEFVEAWTDSGLASELIDDYACTLNCSEAETFAAVFRAFGYAGVAASIVADHASHDECGEEHHECTEKCAPHQCWACKGALAGPTEEYQGDYLCDACRSQMTAAVPA